MVALCQEAATVPEFPLHFTFRMVQGATPRTSFQWREEEREKAETCFSRARLRPGVVLATRLTFTGQKFSPMKGKIGYVALTWGIHLPH